jgi:hypothetical protein
VRLATIIRIALIAAAVITGAIIGSLLIGAILVFTGKPGPCVDRSVPVSSAASARTNEKWDAFKAQAAAGTATVTYTETEITSRGVDYLDEKDVPMSDLQVYFCPQGYAEATGTISGPGRDINVLVRGTLDLSGAKPRIHVMEVQAGNLPGFIATRLVNQVLDRSDVKTLNLSVPLRSLAITDGSATLTSGQ